MYNYYKILDVSFNASQADIKRAYREKAKSCHPDISRSEGAKREFQALNKAYSVLHDPKTRKNYDLLLLYYYYRSKNGASRNSMRDRARRERTTRRNTAYRTQRKGPMTMRPEPSPLFKVGVYSTGFMFGVSLSILILGSILFNEWPYYTSIILFPGFVATYQGWKGIRKNQKDARKYVLKGMGKILNALKGK